MFRKVISLTTWIFQGNPKDFKITEYLRDFEKKGSNICWSIRQDEYVKDINIGDEVYIWRSQGRKKGSGGIIAKTSVLSYPIEMKDDESKSYWVNQADADELLPRVQLAILETFIKLFASAYEPQDLKYCGG